MSRGKAFDLNSVSHFLAEASSASLGAEVDEDMD